MAATTTRQLQQDLNHFTDHFLKYVSHIQVDGVMGPATRNRVQWVKYYLGYLRENRTGKRAYLIDADFLRRLRHPKKRSSYPNWGAFARGRRRRVRQRKLAKPPKPKVISRYGVGMFDGRPCANAAIPILQWCRQHGWHGILVSGWRSREYSQHLCYAMCGRPQCPGRCAGIYTNHVHAEPGNFAVDVSDYGTFFRVVSNCPIAPRLHNYLGARDPVHFSPSGR